jgi:hypothetical protein
VLHRSSAQAVTDPVVDDLEGADELSSSSL